MQSRKWIPVLPLAILFVLQATASQAQEAIGKATSVRPQAEGSHAGTLAGGSERLLARRRFAPAKLVRLICNLKTTAISKWDQIRACMLDKFVYDPNKSNGAVAIEATRGTFRFVTGSQGSGAYKVKTPYGTLGVRG